MKLLEKFTHRQVRSLIRHLRSYSRFRKSETIHQIRIDIKKLRAIIRALHACSYDYRNRNDHRLFQKISHLAGRIRNADVLLQLLLQYHVKGWPVEDTPSYQALLTTFRLQIPEFIKQAKKKGMKLESFSGKVNRNMFNRYLRRKRKKVKGELSPIPQMSMIHEIRKDIKEVLYLSQVNKSVSKHHGFYDKMQELIGTLHDKQVLLDLLKKDNIKLTRTEEEMIQSDCLSDKKEIIRLASEFYK